MLRKSRYLLLLLPALFLAACDAMTNIRAGEAISAAYQELIPSTGTVVIHASAQSGNGRLVLAAKKQPNKTDSFDLFLISGGNVAALASGSAGTQENPVLNQVRSGEDIILFGMKPANAHDEAKPDILKAVVTFNNWRSQELTVKTTSGYIVVINNALPVEMVKLYDSKERLFVAYSKKDGSLQEKELVLYKELVLPKLLKKDDIVAAYMIKQPQHAISDAPKLGAAHTSIFLSAFNENRAQMYRVHTTGWPGFSIKLLLSDSSSVTATLQTGNIVSICCENHLTRNLYQVDSQVLANMLRDYQYNLQGGT